ncbi:MAG: GTP 3',8-cyclase MoaA [Thermodesulfobacteriota bacterium]
MLVDRFNRRINYLRVSLTDRCNLRCIYCMPPEGEKKLRHKDILRYEEILRAVRIGVKLGINKIRITGGEPLVRKDIGDFIPMLTSIDGLEDISLTTNGVLLKENLGMLKYAGITRINISLDSLKRLNFKYITRFDYFNRVWEGIEMARDMGFSPLKLNMVVMRGINDNEILDFGRLALEQPFHVRFIECMPIGLQSNTSAFVANTEVAKLLADQFGPLVSVSPGKNDGPAARFRFEGGKGEVGFISAISHSFCHTCNRLRLTADGKILPCLLSAGDIDLKGQLRKGCLDEDVIKVFQDAVRSKPKHHPLSLENNHRVHRKMCSVGG